MNVRRRLLLPWSSVWSLCGGAGCGNGSSGSNGMMGGGQAWSSTSGPNVFSGSMMGSAPRGYHMSRLTCSAPSLPGSNVHVIVGDMGMTSMMGGALLGGHVRGWHDVGDSDLRARRLATSGTASTGPRLRNGRQR